MNPVILAAIAVTSIGIICALMLVVASKVMAVKEDERALKIRDCLPGVNCGACGYSGCDGYAKALVTEEGVKTNLCIPGADKVSETISSILGVQFENVIEQVATVKCLGSCNATSKKAEYQGTQTCAAAKMLYGGDGLCSFGCLGYGDCASVCPNDAICMKSGIAHIDTRICSGCGLCAKTCPQSIISLVADTQKVIVACSSREKGARVRQKCSRGCIACRKCEGVCPTGAIKVQDNLADIDYSLCTNCGACAEVCPVACIVVSDLTGIHRYTVEK